jgi:hypothetical protein
MSLKRCCCAYATKKVGLRETDRWGSGKLTVVRGELKVDEDWNR